MKYLFLAIFLISSTIHLYASYKDNKPLRNKSKGFIVSSLIGYYALSVSELRWAIILALFFSWLGDMLLIPAGVKWFTAGGISFMISHFFFVLSYTSQVDFAKVPIILIIIVAIIYVLLVLKAFSGLKPYLPKPLFYPMMLYLFINGTMNCFAIFQFATLKSVAAAVTCIGAILFFMSDATLFYVRFKKDSIKHNHFYVMLTYSLAEFLILYGLILIK